LGASPFEWFNATYALARSRLFLAVNFAGTAGCCAGIGLRSGMIVSNTTDVLESARITAHVALLLAVQHQFILEGLEALHMSDYNLLDD
jgi:hypothetical protein